MAWPDESVVRKAISVSNRAEGIRDSIARAWETTLADYPQRAWWRRKGTHASVMWEQSVQNAIQAFDGDAGCKTVPHDDTISFVLDQTVLLRFKRANIELQTQNYPTFLAKLFHAHEAVLPGFEDLHRVEAAYVLNRFQTEIVWIGIVARHKKKLLWQIDLNGESNVVRLPLRDQPRPAAERVLRPKPPLDQPSERTDENE